MEDLFQVAFVTSLALLTYLVLGLAVGRARAKYDVAAPATTGNEIFERYYRVHQNTLEQLVSFVPALWLFATFVSSDWASAIGLLWIVGRIIYARSYYADPEKRGTGFLISYVSQAVLLVGALYSTGMLLIAGYY